MYLCPICDNKVAGGWCKQCHRFVKPLYIKEDIHINESHSTYNDKNCDYHSTDYKGANFGYDNYDGNVNNDNKSVLIKPQPVTAKSDSSKDNKTYSKTSHKKKNNKTASAVVLVIIIISIVSNLFEAIGDKDVEYVVRMISDKISEYTKDSDYDDTSDFDINSLIKDTDDNPLIAKLLEKEPYDFWNSEENDASYYYYDEVAVMSLGEGECDAYHLDYNTDGMISYISDVYDGAQFAYTSVIDPQNNYIADGKYGAKLYLEQDLIGYNEQLSMEVIIDADPLSDRVHGVYLISSASLDAFIENSYRFVKTYDDSLFEDIDAYRYFITKDLDYNTDWIESDNSGLYCYYSKAEDYAYIYIQ